MGGWSQFTTAAAMLPTLSVEAKHAVCQGLRRTTTGRRLLSRT
jgi:hypothetical protein